MPRMTASRTINAPITLVFKTVSDIEQFSKALPHIKKVEFLSQQKSGVGTRFRETRLMNGREATTDLEVKEYVENDRVRLVTEAGGTLWDTVFTVQPQSGGTLLTLTMDATPRHIFARILNKLIGGMIQIAVEQDLDLVKAHCEKAEKAS